MAREGHSYKLLGHKRSHWASRRPKMAPGRPEMASGRPKMAPSWSFEHPHCDRSPVPIHQHIFPTKAEGQHGRTRGSVLLRPAKCAKRASMLAGCTRGVTQHACRHGGQHRLRAPQQGITSLCSHLLRRSVHFPKRSGVSPTAFRDRLGVTRRGRPGSSFFFPRDGRIGGAWARCRHIRPCMRSGLYP